MKSIIPLILSLNSIIAWIILSNPRALYFSFNPLSETKSPNLWSNFWKALNVVSNIALWFTNNSLIAFIIVWFLVNNAAFCRLLICLSKYGLSDTSSSNTSCCTLNNLFLSMKDS